MGDNKSKKNIFGKAADGASITSNIVQGASSILGAAAEAAPVLASFASFLPLIKEIGAVFEEIIDIVDVAEHNKRTCKLLQKKVRAAKSAVQDLREEKDEKEEFFNNENFSSLQELSRIIKRIKDFIIEISQMKTLSKYIKAKSIEKNFIDLSEEFDNCVSLLSFSITVKTSEDLKQLKADQEELAKYLEEMVEGIKTGIKGIGDDVKDIGANTKEMKAHIINLSNQVSSTAVKVNAMNNTMEKFMNETSQDQTKIDNIFKVLPLNLSDFKEDDYEPPRKAGRVTKWYNIRNEGEELAFKTISDEEQKIVHNQVTILKELHDWQNIIKFYGLTSDGNKWYLVTEWAEYGNLREFYTTHKGRFDLKLKLRMSLDIARGLNFLRTVEIVHRDIRAENILITINETAKLANFKLSRYLTTATLNHSQNLERARYCAPELLVRAKNFQYNQKCEVYSFGILLWEIAEERIPYEDSNDILEITDMVYYKKYRESFTENSQMPEEFKRLELEAVRHDPTFRPKITKILEVLRNCVRSQDSPHPSKNNTMKRFPSRQFSIDHESYALPIGTNLQISPNLESFNYMTLADAAKQHKMVKNNEIIGDTETAYKCFEAYANFENTAKRNQIMAKYYKVVYILRGLAESPPDKDKIIAELSKEVADDEENEFPEAKVRYADCLLNGKGVEQNKSEALKYFEKAAQDGLKVAMYNTGNMYYNGIGCEKDEVKAKEYMELAIINGYEPAIKFREEYHL